MSRLLALMLTFWIPIKKYRKALRGILIFGIFKYIKIRNIDKCKNYDNVLSIVVIIKNEGAYIKEWLDYHILVGVNKFFIYDNDSSDDTLSILQPYIKEGRVVYTFFPGINKQIDAYNDCIEKHKNDTRWLAIIDLDEFLVPVVDKDLPTLLSKLPFFSQLIVTWVIYGSSGHKNKPDGMVIENYKYHIDKNRGVKSIINPRLILKVTNPHANEVAGITIDEEGRSLGYVDQTNNPPSCKKIRVNHYVTKSYSEYMERRSRITSVGTYLSDLEKHFYEHDRNEVYDPLMDKYVTFLKRLYNGEK